MVRSVEAPASPKERGDLSTPGNPLRRFSLRVRLGHPLGEEEDDDEP